jgi:tRNA A58 N-methylase Trm61
MTGPPRDAEANEYVLGTDAAELQRLGFQHRVWSAPAFALWERAGVAQGKAVLDVGCGPGRAALDLARLVGPQGLVLAVDVSERFVAHLQAEAARLGLGQVETRVADTEVTSYWVSHEGQSTRRMILEDRLPSMLA